MASAPNSVPPPLALCLERHARWVVAGLLLLFAVSAWSAVREKSTTFDEMAHLTAGTAYWKTGDYRLHPENGILPQRLEALPLVLMGAKFPDTDQPAWWTSDVWKMGYQFFYTLGNNLERMLWWARGTVVALGVVLGWVVYAWSRRLFGVVGGLVSLAAYVFCPNILAHSALATSDLAATLLFVASLGTIWMVLHRVTLTTVALSAVVMGLLFVSKMSAVLILPVAVLLVGIRLVAGGPLEIGWRRSNMLVRERWRQALVFAGLVLVHAVVVVATIWLFYGFRYATFREAEPERDRMYFDATIRELTRHSVVGSFVRFADNYRLLPQPYLHGFAFAVQHSQTRTAFFAGERGESGWRSFFPYAFLVKTPLPTIGLMAVAAWGAIAGWTAANGQSNRHRKRVRRRMDRAAYRTAPLWVFLIVYWSMAIHTNLNIGHRHILPTYPVMFILCGAAGYWLVGRAKWPRVIVVALVVLLAVESLGMYPHYLAYFNQLVGGPRHGYRQLVDSSLDWGQDLPGLKRWLDEQRNAHGNVGPVYLSYFGTGSPRHYGIDANILPGYPGWDRREFFPLEPGTYCISATMLPCIYLLPRQAWNDDYERAYQRDREAVDEMLAMQRDDPGLYERLQADPAHAEDARAWSEILQRFDQFRFARLCAYLWGREPDDSAGHSILIYHLDAAELDAALNEPTPD
jgi:4-amino-4-deoxy-L-arabinose transferase-like glycosyltransferase